MDNVRTTLGCGLLTGAVSVMSQGSLGDAPPPPPPLPPPLDDPPPDP